MPTMKRISIKKADLKPSLYRAIKAHALGSIYRMNAKTASIYTFSPDDNGNTWRGGWAWLQHPSTWDGNLAIFLKDGKLYQLNK